MTTFVVEHFLPTASASERQQYVARVGAARAELAAHGASHRLTMVIPTDEMSLELYDADAAETVVAAHRAAGLAFDRVVEVDLHAP